MLTLNWTTLQLLNCLTLFYPVRKVFLRKEVNLFDLWVIFHVIYLVLIPLRDKFIYQECPDFTSDIRTAIAIAITCWLLLVLSLMRRKSNKSDSIFDITAFIRTHKFDVEKIPTKILWVIFVLVGIFLYNETNYSAVKEETAGNGLQIDYSTLSWPLKLYWLAIEPIMPLLTIITIQMTGKRVSKKLQQLRIVILFIIGISLPLGSKTFMVLCLFIIAIYFYSLYREKIKKRHIVSMGFVAIIVLFVVFPLSQGLRMYKVNAVLSGGPHDFGTVVRGFATEGASDYEFMNQYATVGLARRSMGVYIVLDALIRNEETLDGLLTWSTLKNICHAADNRVGNILAELLYNGGDVAESFISWFVADWGELIGPFVSIVFFILFAYLYYLYGTLAVKLTKRPELYVVLYFWLLQLVVRIENNPCPVLWNFFNMYWVPYFIMFWILYFCRFKKKPGYTPKKQSNNLIVADANKIKELQHEDRRT